MISLGLSAANQALFEQALYTGYNLRVVVQILDLNHRYISDISDLLVDGQVNYSYWEPISYSASMTLLDPDNRVGFDTSSPADNALYADRMIRLLYCVWVDTTPPGSTSGGGGYTDIYPGAYTDTYPGGYLSDYSDVYTDSYTYTTPTTSTVVNTGFWVDVPIFCGPVTKVKRDDAILSVECQGKESLVSAPTLAWTAKTYPKGWRGVDAIRSVMENFAGETKFDLPEFTYPLGHDYVLNATTVPWEFVNVLSASRHIRQLWYDGRGVLRFREKPARPVWTFTEDTLLSVPQLDYNHADIRNAATVRGATPEGKPQLRAHRYLPAAHHSSPQAMGRNGKNRYMMEIVDDTTLATQAAVNVAADKLLVSIQNTNVGFEFDSFPIPHLEVGDIVHLSTRDVSINLMVDQYSLPLKAGSPQSNGTIRKVSANRARLRR